MRSVSRAPRPASCAAGPLTAGQQRVEHHPGGIPGRQQLVAVLTGVAAAAHPHRHARQGRVGVTHVVHVGGQAQFGEHVRRARALHGQHRVGPVLVGDGQPRGCGLFQRGDHGGGVGGVGHQEDLVGTDVVGDQVVDDAARVVAAQRVLRLTRLNAIEVVGERGVDELRGAGPANQCLAQVTDIEQAHGVAGSGVLGDGAGVRHRHQPSAELGELRAQFAMTVLQGSVQQHRLIGISP